MDTMQCTTQHIAWPQTQALRILMNLTECERWFQRICSPFTPSSQAQAHHSYSFLFCVCLCIMWTILWSWEPPAAMYLVSEVNGNEREQNVSLCLRFFLYIFFLSSSLLFFSLLVLCARFLLTHHRHNLNDTKISYDSWSIPIVMHRNERPRRQRRGPKNNVIVDGCRWCRRRRRRRQQQTKRKIKRNSRKRQFKQRLLPCGASKNITKMKKSLVFEFDSLSLLFVGSQWIFVRACNVVHVYASYVLFRRCCLWVLNRNRNRNDRMCKKGNLLWPPQVWACSIFNGTANKA